MLYTENLEEIIFHRHEMFQTDELIVLSGYVGPRPIQRLHTLPFHSRVVYGMYGAEGIQRVLHNSLIGLQNEIENINIFYSNFPVHSKCYAWRNRGQIVHALVGSANFSSNGLTTPFREILAETTHDTFNPLNDYISRVLNNSISCLEVEAVQIIEQVATAETVCSLSLLARDGEVQNAAGLNWGQSARGHITRNDAYIKIRIQDILQFPELFPPKQLSPNQQDGRGRPQRHNDKIDIIWDDGTNMEGIFFGNQYIGNVLYPKQVGSFPSYSEMGRYFRQRLRVPLEQPIRRHHLDRYGRTDVGVSILSEGIYKFDFSV
jgi:hypothetical protein